MITPLTPKALRGLRSEQAICEHFIGLVRNFHENPPRHRDTITKELSLLVIMCNHHRRILWNIYQSSGAMESSLNTWLYELSTIPSGDWPYLRLALTPFIRTFGRLPRPKGVDLLSPEHPGSPDLQGEVERTTVKLHVFPNQEEGTLSTNHSKEHELTELASG